MLGWLNDVFIGRQEKILCRICELECNLMETVESLNAKIDVVTKGLSAVKADTERLLKNAGTPQAELDKLGAKFDAVTAAVQEIDVLGGDAPVEPPTEAQRRR